MDSYQQALKDFNLNNDLEQRLILKLRMMISVMLEAHSYPRQLKPGTLQESESLNVYLFLGLQARSPI